MESRALIAGGETFTTEFKRSDISAKDLTKAVACLANGEGGVLLIGVDDDGTVVGASPRHGQVTNPERVAAYIQANTEPALAVGVHLETIDGHEVIRIDVPRADPGPVGTKLGVFTKRVLKSTGQPECAPMTAHEIVSMGMVTRGQDFAASIARDASMDDLDPLEFDRLRRLCQEAGDELADLSDDDVLRALGLVPIAAPVSIGAVLLFGTDAALQRWVPNAEVLFQDARSGHRSTNIRIAEPLLGTAERLRELIDARNTVTELMAGLYRIEIPLIPSITRREAVANALVHRDY
ncbi:MAG: putative DNA binding domain-containing protein, partial [Mycobacterium sp.]|nr:putative DNA binding domain-containing protein [Mycobacterium sp.]